MLTTICALAFFAVYQQSQITELHGGVANLKKSVDAMSGTAIESETRALILKNYILANPAPSKLMQSMVKSLEQLRARYGRFEETPTSLAYKRIPEANATYHQRNQVRVFVPDNEVVQLRLAVFPCTMYRSRDFPPLSEKVASTILTENPFSIPSPVYIDLDSGEHSVLIQWRGDTQTITVSVDDVERYESQYKRESKLSYKYQFLGSRPNEGIRKAKPGQESLSIVVICPGGGAKNDPMEHAWKCELVRGSLLGDSGQMEAAK